MPGSVKNFFQKKASSLKNAITGKKKDETQSEFDSFSLWSDESVLSYRERSYSCEGPDTRVETRLHTTNGAARCLSEEVIHRYKKQDVDKNTAHFSSEIENEDDAVRRCWSEYEINKVPKKKSLFKRLLCTIPEMDHNETKYAYGQNKPKNVRVTYESVPNTFKEVNEDDISIAFTVDTEDKTHKTEENLMLKVTKIDTDEKNCESEDVTVAKRFKDPATSSGISSLQFDLPDKDEGPLMKEFIETACENTVQGQFSSTPQLNTGEEDSFPQEGPAPGGHVKQSQSLNNITASGNLQFNFFDGAGRASESPTSPSALFVNTASQQNEDTDKLQAKSSVQMRKLDAMDTITDRTVFSKALEVLHRDKGNRVVILLSYSGEGKTVTGIYLMKKATSFKHRYLVRSTKEWETIFIEEKPRPNTIVFIDNYLGKDKFSQKQFEEWEPFLDEIFSACTNGNVSVVISMHKSVFAYYIKHHRRHGLFANEFVMDLNNEYKLSPKERTCLIRNHLKGLKHNVNVQFCKEQSDDNTEDFNGTGVLKIWNGTIEQIEKLQYQIGFPKALEEFASSIDNIKEGVSFFLKPTVEDVKASDEIRRSKDPFHKQKCYAIGTVLNNGGKLSRDGDSIEIVMPLTGHSGSKTRSNNARKKMSLTDSLTKRLPDDTDPYIFLSEGLEEIRGDFIEKDEETFHFHCTSIHYSVAISFGKAFPNDLINLMPFDFIQKYIGPSKMFTDDCSLYIELNPNTYESLAERLIRQIKHKNVKEAMEHAAMGEKSFVTAFLKYVEKEAKLAILFQTVDAQDYTVICYGMQKQYTRSSEVNNFTEQVLKSGLWAKHMKKKPQLKESQERECLRIALVKGNIVTSRILIEHMKSIDDESFESIIKSGSTDLLNTVYKYPTYKLDISKALITTCSYHWESDHALAMKMAKALLTKEKNLLVKAHFRTALKEAIDNNNVNLIHMLKLLGADVNAKIHDMSLLQMASLKGHTACVNFLLENDVDTAASSANGMTALHSAIDAGYYDTAAVLFRKNAALLTVQDKSERIPLHIASGKADIGPELISEMIDFGSDTSAREKDRKTPLHIAITARNLEIVKVLTSRGAPATWKDANGQSPIVLAYKENLYYEVEAIFRENGIREFYDVDLLFKALEMQQKSLVKCMLQQINVNVANAKGQTLLDVAIGMNLSSMVQLLLHEEEIDLETESKGILPIHKAVIQGNLEILKLLTAKANITSVDRKTGDNILHVAAKFGLLDIVTYILGKIPDLADSRNFKGDTPLKIAVDNGHDDITRLLLINIEAKSCKGIHELLMLETLALRKRNLAKGRNDADQATKFNKIVNVLQSKKRAK